ncbi:dense granule protein gra1 [Cystoisospora suis]|uniref:Dense granule protein gra1 n=1 Tax=Cystoisospora suis TaxID=483139 RepID=A0A2C6KYX9_9APIC|nr:dense granule protein gra1 [Cystoisospora suis]
MSRVLRIVCAATAVVAVFGGGVSASEERPVLLRLDPKDFARAAFGSSGDVSANFPVGNRVKFQVLGQDYEVARLPETPAFLTISAMKPSGESEYIGDVGIDEVRTVLEQVGKDKKVMEDALARGETVPEAIEDVARSEGLSEEQAQELGAAAEVAQMVAEDQTRVLEDERRLAEDERRLAEDRAALQEDLAFLQAAAGEAQ